jgi:hypothetical protein
MLKDEELESLTPLADFVLQNEEVTEKYLQEEWPVEEGKGLDEGSTNKLDDSVGKKEELDDSVEEDISLSVPVGGGKKVTFNFLGQYENKKTRKDNLRAMLQHIGFSTASPAEELSLGNGLNKNEQKALLKGFKGKYFFYMAKMCKLEQAVKSEGFTLEGWESKNDTQPLSNTTVVEEAQDSKPFTLFGEMFHLRCTEAVKRAILESIAFLQCEEETFKGLSLCDWSTAPNHARYRVAKHLLDCGKTKLFRHFCLRQIEVLPERPKKRKRAKANESTDSDTTEDDSGASGANSPLLGGICLGNVIGVSKLTDDRKLLEQTMKKVKASTENAQSEQKDVSLLVKNGHLKEVVTTEDIILKVAEDIILKVEKAAEKSEGTGSSGTESSGTESSGTECDKKVGEEERLPRLQKPPEEKVKGIHQKPSGTVSYASEADAGEVLKQEEPVAPVEEVRNDKKEVCVPLGASSPSETVSYAPEVKAMQIVAPELTINGAIGLLNEAGGVSEALNKHFNLDSNKTNWLKTYLSTVSPKQDLVGEKTEDLEDLEDPREDPREDLEDSREPEEFEIEIKRPRKTLQRRHARANLKYKMGITHQAPLVFDEYKKAYVQRYVAVKANKKVWVKVILCSIVMYGMEVFMPQQGGTSEWLVIGFFLGFFLIVHMLSYSPTYISTVLTIVYVNWVQTAKFAFVPSQIYACVAMQMLCLERKYFMLIPVAAFLAHSYFTGKSWLILVKYSLTLVSFYKGHRTDDSLEKIIVSPYRHSMLLVVSVLYTILACFGFL